MPDDDNDPLCYPGTEVLRNKFGISDAGALRTREADVTTYRITQLRTEYTHGAFNAQHLQNLHKHIFGDLYDWAGQFRSMNMWKGGQIPFARPEFIEPSLNKVFDQLAREGRLKGLPADRWADRAAFYLGEINAIHPFREGNGRTNREFVRELAEENGLAIQWDKVPKLEWNEASKESFLTTNNLQLRRLLLMSVDEDPPRGRPERGKQLGQEKDLVFGRERDFLF
jgi:cell filamentation protein